MSSRVAPARDRRRAKMLRWAARRAVKRRRRTVAWYARELGRFDWSNASGPPLDLDFDIEDALAAARELEGRFAGVTHLAVCAPTLAKLTSMLHVATATATASFDFDALPLVRDDTVPLGAIEKRTGRHPRRSALEPLLPMPFIAPTPVDPELMSWGDSVIAKLRPVLADLDRMHRAVFAIDDIREVPGSVAADEPVAGVEG